MIVKTANTEDSKQKLLAIIDKDAEEITRQEYIHAQLLATALGIFDEKQFQEWRSYVEEHGSVGAPSCQS